MTQYVGIHTYDWVLHVHPVSTSSFTKNKEQSTNMNDNKSGRSKLII